MFQELFLDPGRRRRAVLLIYAGIAVVAALVFAVDPAGSSLFPKCLLHRTTGLHCPGCGSTRAVHHLLHGRVATAFRFNPLLMLVLPVLAYGALSDLALVARGRGLPGLPVNARTIGAAFAAVVAFTVLRNIPAYPFSLLAP